MKTPLMLVKSLGLLTLITSNLWATDSRELLREHILGAQSITMKMQIFDEYPSDKDDFEIFKNYECDFKRTQMTQGDDEFSMHWNVELKRLHKNSAIKFKLIYEKKPGQRSVLFAQKMFMRVDAPPIVNLFKTMIDGNKDEVRDADILISTVDTRHLAFFQQMEATATTESSKEVAPTANEKEQLLVDLHFFEQPKGKKPLIESETVRAALSSGEREGIKEIENHGGSISISAPAMDFPCVHIKGKSFSAKSDSSCDYDILLGYNASEKTWGSVYWNSLFTDRKSEDSDSDSDEDSETTGQYITVGKWAKWGVFGSDGPKRRMVISLKVEN